jgi:hypothetical protein
MAGEEVTGGASRFSRRARPRDEASFTRNLRFELADEEGRALLGSRLLSAGFGLLWILLVMFGPQTDISHLLPPEERPISVTFEPPPPPDVPVKPEATQPVPAAAKAAAPAGKPKPSADEIAAKRAAAASAAFGPSPAANGPVGDVSNVLRGVDVASGAPTPGAAAGKAVLAYGQGGQGVRTPGRADMGGGAGVGNLGGVSGGGGIGHEGVAVSAPKAIDVPGLGGPTRDMGELGTAVRSHDSQLRFCYDEYGLKVNPGLAGSVTLALTMTGGGTVTNAVVNRRTWSGPGASEAESCILEKAKEWHFPASPAGGGTFEFSFNFTK